MYQIILFCSNTLHVSDGLSGHHQQFKTVHRATGICHTDTADCLQASSQLYAGICLHTRQSSTQNNKSQVSHRYSCFSWWWTYSRPKHVEKRNKHTKKNCVPTGFIYKIHVTRPICYKLLDLAPQQLQSADHKAALRSKFSALSRFFLFNGSQHLPSLRIWVLSLSISQHTSNKI